MISVSFLYRKESIAFGSATDASCASRRIAHQEDAADAGMHSRTVDPTAGYRPSRLDDVWSSALRPGSAARVWRSADVANLQVGWPAGIRHHPERVRTSANRRRDPGFRQSHIASDRRRLCAWTALIPAESIATPVVEVAKQDFFPWGAARGWNIGTGGPATAE